jgi:hypothetical protein
VLAALVAAAVALLSRSAGISGYSVQERVSSPIVDRWYS